MKLTSKLLITLIKEQMEYPDSQSHFEKIKKFILDGENYGLGLYFFESLEDQLHPEHASALKRIIEFADMFFKHKEMVDGSDESLLNPKQRREQRAKIAISSSELDDKFEELFGFQSKFGNEIKKALNFYP
tara:strand:- start:380 stop:772 length:393 start_codon:yes stop_codon:yes gene_type:complete